MGMAAHNRARLLAMQEAEKERRANDETIKDFTDRFPLDVGDAGFVKNVLDLRRYYLNFTSAQLDLINKDIIDGLEAATLQALERCIDTNDISTAKDESGAATGDPGQPGEKGGSPKPDGDNKPARGRP